MTEAFDPTTAAAGLAGRRPTATPSLPEVQA